MISEEKFEELCMTIIANSGEGRSLAYSAIQKAKEGMIEEAEETFKASLASMSVAHTAHSELLRLDSSGELTQNALSIHAQCHIMCSIVAQENARHIIDLYKEIKGQVAK